jgi:hypothetical protein
MTNLPSLLPLAGAAWVSAAIIHVRAATSDSIDTTSFTVAKRKSSGEFFERKSYMSKFSRISTVDITADGDNGHIHAHQPAPLGTGLFEEDLRRVSEAVGGSEFIWKLNA